MSERSDTGAAHQGADLGNRLRGGLVRAAAAGLVVRGRGDDWQAGYGYYVTLAHRLRDGSLVYTVYAHLAKGSVRPRAGSCVEQGQPIGRVGRSGRASSAHLHFEVRRPSDPAERWEKSAVEDPIAFVRGRLMPSAGSDAAVGLDHVATPGASSESPSSDVRASLIGPLDPNRERARPRRSHPPARRPPSPR